MNKLHVCGFVAWLLVAGATMAQTTPSTETPPNPAPSTSPTEGTAADRTKPGETPTQGTSRDVPQPRGPATDPAEGTAADRTPPSSRAQEGGTTQPELVGLQVVSPSNAPIGKVVDVVFDSQGQPDYVVIASQGNNAAVPFQTASSMIEGGKVIIDQARLQQAPKVDKGEWRDKEEGAWKDEATRYWEYQG